MEKEVKFTAEEAQTLVNLLNVANKAAGLEAAEACLHFVKKLKAVFDSKEDATVEDAVEVK